MKSLTVPLFLIILLFSLLFRLDVVVLPFLHQKYMYWIFFGVTGSVFLLLKDINRKWKVNQYDCCILLLFCFGLYNFAKISNATIFNFKVWCWLVLFLLYIALRRALDTKEKLDKTAITVYYFLSSVGMVNALISALQYYGLISSANEFFRVTGLFFSPNQSGLLFAISFLSTIAILKKSSSKWQKILLYGSLIVFICGLYFSECRGAFLALFIGMFIGAENFIQKSRHLSITKKIVISSLLLFVLLAIMGITNSIKGASASGRLFIVKQSLMQIKAQPVLGSGFDSFSTKFNYEKAKYFETGRPWQEIKNANYIYNANNDFIELTFELGIIFSSFLAFLLFSLIFRSKQNEANTSSIAILVCLVFFSFTNTILAVPLFLVLGCIFTVLLVNGAEEKNNLIFDNSILIQTGAVLFSISLLCVVILRMHAEYRLRVIYEGKKVSSLLKVKKYAAKIDANGEQLFMAGIIMLKNKDWEEGLQYLLNGFEKSGKPGLGKKLASFYERIRNYEEAEKIYIYNKNVEPFRFDARMDLLRLYSKTHNKAKAKNMACEILNLNVKIPSEVVDRYRKEARYFCDSLKLK